MLVVFSEEEYIEVEQEELSEEELTALLDFANDAGFNEVFIIPEEN